MWISEVGDNVTKFIIKNYKFRYERFTIEHFGVTSQIEGFTVEFYIKLLQRGFYNVFARNEVGDGFCDLEIISIGKLIYV